jgi:hypothetical protein
LRSKHVRLAGLLSWVKEFAEGEAQRLMLEDELRLVSGSAAGGTTMATEAEAMEA